MATAVLSTKGQVVIPAEVRTQLGLSEGDRLDFCVDGPIIIVRRVQTRAERRRARMAQAFKDYVASAPEKVWTELDGEDFVDG